jgi:hypothetical protein
MRQNFSIPVHIEGTSITPQPELPLESRLKFVQVGIWELRRRWLAGQTAGLDNLLACLDEDVTLLREAIQSDDSDCVESEGAML